MFEPASPTKIPTTSTVQIQPCSAAAINASETFEYAMLQPLDGDEIGMINIWFSDEAYFFRGRLCLSAELAHFENGKLCCIIIQKSPGPPFPPKDSLSPGQTITTAFYMGILRPFVAVKMS